MRSTEEIFAAAIEEVSTGFDLSDNPEDYEASLPIDECQPQRNSDGSYTYTVEVTYKGQPSPEGGRGVYTVEVYDNQISADCWRCPDGDCYGLQLGDECEGAD